MSHGIKKDTYINADEETTKALTFDLLDSMNHKLDETVNLQTQQVEACNGRFKKIEKRKRVDTAVAASSGFGGGFIAMAVFYIRQWIKGN